MVRKKYPPNRQEAFEIYLSNQIFTTCQFNLQIFIINRFHTFSIFHDLKLAFIARSWPYYCTPCLWDSLFSTSPVLSTAQGEAAACACGGASLFTSGSAPCRKRKVYLLLGTFFFLQNLFSRVWYYIYFCENKFLVKINNAEKKVQKVKFVGIKTYFKEFMIIYERVNLIPDKLHFYHFMKINNLRKKGVLQNMDRINVVHVNSTWQWRKTYYSCMHEFWQHLRFPFILWRLNLLTNQNQKQSTRVCCISGEGSQSYTEW